MKHCPNPDCASFERSGRAAEFVDAIETCSDCGARLEPGEAPEASRPEYLELVTVYETSDQPRAHLIRGLLAESGIDAHVGGDSLQGAMGELPITMLSIRVQVPPDDAARAREMIVEAEARET